MASTQKTRDQHFASVNPVPTENMTDPLTRMARFMPMGQTYWKCILGEFPILYGLDIYCIYSDPLFLSSCA